MFNPDDSKILHKGFGLDIRFKDQRSNSKRKSPISPGPGIMNFIYLSIILN